MAAKPKPSGATRVQGYQSKLPLRLTFRSLSTDAYRVGMRKSREAAARKSRDNRAAVLRYKRPAKLTGRERARTADRGLQREVLEANQVLRARVDRGGNVLDQFEIAVLDRRKRFAAMIEVVDRCR